MHPDGDELVILEAWRSEEAFRASLAAVVEAALAEAGRTASAPVIQPAWSIARP